MGGRNDLQVQINQQTQIKINEMSDRVNQRQVTKSFLREVFRFLSLNSRLFFYLGWGDWYAGRLSQKYYSGVAPKLRRQSGKLNKK